MKKMSLRSNSSKRKPQFNKERASIRKIQLLILNGENECFLSKNGNKIEMSDLITSCLRFLQYYQTVKIET